MYQQLQVHVGVVQAAVGPLFCEHDNEPLSTTDCGGFLE